MKWLLVDSPAIVFSEKDEIDYSEEEIYNEKQSKPTKSRRKKSRKPRVRKEK